MMLFSLGGFLAAVLVLISRNSRRSNLVMFLATSYLILAAWAAFLSLTNLDLEWYRFFPYLLFLGVILISERVSRTQRIQINRAFVALFLALMIASELVVGVALYQSPWTNSVNTSATYGEIASASWFAVHAPPRFLYLPTLLNVGYFLTATQGSDFPYGGLAESPPPHLNYSAALSYVHAFGLPVGYLFVPAYFSSFYESSYPQFPNKWEYNTTDFRNLLQSSTTSMIYSSPDMDILQLS